MKKYLCFFILLLSSINYAQDYNFIGWESNFGFGFGLELNNQNLNYSGFINNFKKENYEIPSHVKSLGYSGFIYLMLIKNLRLGFKGFNANETQNKTFDNEIKSSTVEISSFGLTVEYTLPVVRKPAFTLGIEIGRVEADFFFHHYKRDLIQSGWSKIDDQLITKSLFSINFKDKFYIFTPLINIDYPLSRFILLRAGLGYQIPFSNSVSYYNGLKNDSIGKLVNNGTIISIGLFAGFFAF